MFAPLDRFVVWGVMVPRGLSGVFVCGCGGGVLLWYGWWVAVGVVV